MRAIPVTARISFIIAQMVCISQLFWVSIFPPSSSPGEFHPQALTDPDVTVSRHPALIDQPKMAALLLKGSSSAMQSWPPNKADRSNPFAPSPLRDFSATTSWCWDRNAARAVLSGELPIHAPFRYMQRVPNSTLTHVSASPPFHPGRSDFPSPVGDLDHLVSFPHRTFPITSELKC